MHFYNTTLNYFINNHHSYTITYHLSVRYKLSYSVKMDEWWQTTCTENGGYQQLPTGMRWVYQKVNTSASSSTIPKAQDNFMATSLSQHSSSH